MVEKSKAAMEENAPQSDDLPPKKPVMFMGRNLEEIPCLKTVFQTSIVSGLGIGLATFMFTSRPKRAADAGFYSFVAITTFYWFYCRYQYSVQKFNYQKLQKYMKNAVVLEGTEHDPNKAETTPKEA
uniref:Cytochrome c oxidase assembly protein COX20, mitochondrial n=1 Tax=Ixodes ricinus TaxID=34613 RepID=A0A0K8RIV9_IXORI